MLSIKSLGLAGSPEKGGSGSLASYFEHLSIEGYYQNGDGDPPGNWEGKLATAFGLSGTVRPGQLQKLFEGCHPDTGDALASNAGAEHKSGWDCTFSCPKSVSVAWALADPERQQQIAQAHDEAVKAALAYLEQNAFSSRDRNGESPLRGIIAATFQHSTSRELDPQLHTHCAIANLGLRQDGRVCALDLDSRVKMACGGIYRSELAQRLKSLNFSIERDGKSFKLSSVPDDLCTLFSKRRQQIEDYLEEHSEFGGTAKAANVAALATRKSKESPNRRILQERWQREAEAAGYSRESMQQMVRPDPGITRDLPSLDIPAIIAGLTQNESFCTRQQLEAAIAIECQGICGAAEIPMKIEKAIREGLANPALDGLVRLSEPIDQQKSRRKIDLYTTREMLKLEQQALAAAIEKSKTKKHAVTLDESLLQGLDPGQASAVREVTNAKGMACVVGLAGTGKSHMMGVANRIWNAHGFEVIGACLAGKAADGLESGSGIKSQTLHSLLAELDSGTRTLTEKSIVVLDEAGMVDTRLMSRLIDHAQISGAKQVLCGDPQQIQSIGSGGLFKAISERIGHASLTEIRRQRNEQDRETIKKLISGEAEEVIQRLDDAGQLRFERDDQVAEQMVNDWMAHRDPLCPGESLMLASTRAEVRTLNRIARKKLVATGELHSEVSIPTPDGERSYFVGERICMLRNSRSLGVKNGQLGTLESWAMDIRTGKLNVSVRMDGGSLVSFDPEQYGHFDSGFGLSIHKSQGVTAQSVSVLMMNEQMLDQQLSYVAISRHRERLRVFVPNSTEEELGRALARSRLKTLASDLATSGEMRKLQPEKPGKTKGFERV